MFDLCTKNNALRLINVNELFDTLKDFACVTNDVLCGFVTYNLANDAIKIANYLNASGVDTLVVDNCSDSINSKKLYDGVISLPHIKLIRTKSNLGGAGGYAVLCEIFLRSNYEHLLLTEDDATPAESDLVNKLVESKFLADIVRTHYYNNNTFSFSFHFTLYSRRLMEGAGIPDPRFFQGGDDADLLDRQIRFLNSIDGNIAVIDRGYYHPTLKGSGSPAKVIRSQRNCLLSNLANRKFLSFAVRSYAFLAYGFFYFLKGKLFIAKSVFLSFLTVRNMANANDPFIADLRLIKSRDIALHFERVSISSISGRLGSIHLKALFPDIKTGKSDSLILTTLDSPWAVVYGLLYSNFLIIRNPDVNMSCIDAAICQFGFINRIVCLISLFLAFAINPLFMILYIYAYYRYFSLTR